MSIVTRAAADRAFETNIVATVNRLAAARWNHRRATTKWHLNSVIAPPAGVPHLPAARGSAQGWMTQRLAWIDSHYLPDRSSIRTAGTCPTDFRSSFSAPARFLSPRTGRPAVPKGGRGDGARPMNCPSRSPVRQRSRRASQHEVEGCQGRVYPRKTSPSLPSPKSYHPPARSAEMSGVPQFKNTGTHR
jgi:hypothetical protein